jgi:transposase
MPNMISRLFVKHLSNNDITALEAAQKSHSKPSARRRAQIILLNNKGYSVGELVPIVNLSRQSISQTINNWEHMGLDCLLHKDKSGRPPKLTPEQDKLVLKMVKKSPRNLKSVLSQIQTEFGIKLGLSALKKRCKAEGLT